MRDLNLTYDTHSNRAMAAKLQRLNMMRDTNGQPMLLHQSRPETMLHRSIGGAYSGGAYSGGAYSGGATSSRIQEMDESVPMRRPPGMVEPHGRTPKYVMASYAAGYPIYNSLELQQIDGGNIWQDMNAWGKRNEPGLKKFGKAVGDAAKKYGPTVAKLAAKGAVGYLAPEFFPLVAGLGYEKKKKMRLSKREREMMEGGNVFQDMSRGLKRFGRTVGRTVKKASPAIGEFAKEQGINLAKSLGKVAIDMAVKKVTGGKMKGQSARGTLIKKIMRDHGMSMIQASKYIKQNGLY